MRILYSHIYNEMLTSVSIKFCTSFEDINNKTKDLACVNQSSSASAQRAGESVRWERKEISHLTTFKKIRIFLSNEMCTLLH